MKASPSIAYVDPVVEAAPPVADAVTLWEQIAKVEFGAGEDPPDPPEGLSIEHRASRVETKNKNQFANR